MKKQKFYPVKTNEAFWGLVYVIYLHQKEVTEMW